MNIQEMEKRLRVLEDLEAIRNLHNEYVFGLNNRQWDFMAECFTEDATANIFRHGLRRGKPEIHKLFTDIMSHVNVGKGRDCHFIVQPVIKVEGDKARGHWLLYILLADPVTGNAMRWTQGRYDCEYARVDGKWKFSSLIFTNPWPRTPDTLPKYEETGIA